MPSAGASLEPSGQETPPVGSGPVGAPTGVGIMRSDLVVQLENTAFALLVGTILLGMPVLSRLLGLG